jgi:ubiquinone/menaquinone biosynthesis C-methylase UbiE
LDDPLQQVKAKAAATYDTAADHFDDEPLGFWKRIGERTVDCLALPPGANVLDVGCGTGASALPAAQVVGPNGFVVGVDLSARLLDLARTKAAMHRLRNVEFRLADMTALALPDGCFDAVVSVFSIFFVPDMEGLVRELWRMVRPGGKLAVTTWGPRIFEPAYARWLAAIQRERPDLYSAFNPWDRITDVEAVRRLLRDGGVTDADVIGKDGLQPLRSAEDWWIIALGSGLRWTIEQMGPDAAARVRADNIQWLRENGIKAANGQAAPLRSSRRGRSSTAMFIALLRPANCVSRICRAFDGRVACFEHRLEAHRPIGSNGLTQQVVGRNSFKTGGLAVIPFSLVVMAVRTNQPMFGGNFVPPQRFDRAGSPDTV